jgi:hypothetical protein
VPSREKNGVIKLHEGAELLGKKARNAQESVKGDNLLFMKTWLAQVHEPEDFLLQEKT